MKWPLNTLRILKHLRSNARHDTMSISLQTGIPEDAVRLRIREYEHLFIKKHTSLIDYQILGFGQWHQIAIKLADTRVREFLNYIMNHKNVNSVFEVNGGYDYIIETVHRTLREYADFLKDLTSRFSIANKKEFQIINDIKRETFLSNTLEEWQDV
ncbi:Lrp/AsnC family transcriptional regulator [Candidatus Woesearchaeota archaeon]|nr:Lrp/AsnC family transcriptional regulator [Candidatus Woesearchaeota archaeon]